MTYLEHLIKTKIKCCEYRPRFLHQNSLYFSSTVNILEEV